MLGVPWFFSRRRKTLIAVIFFSYRNLFYGFKGVTKNMHGDTYRCLPRFVIGNLLLKRQFKLFQYNDIYFMNNFVNT